MRKLNLFLDLMSITHDLIQEGITSDNVNVALINMDHVFDDFEENDGVNENNIHKMFEDTFFKVEHLPEELKQYCYPMEGFHRKSEIYLGALPTQGNNMEQAQLIAGIFSILNNLLDVGITACHNHQARMQMYDLFNTFERQEDIKTAQHLKALQGIEQEDIKAEARLRKILDDIATKDENMHPELKEYFRIIEDLPKSDDINDDDLQAILVVSAKKPKPRSINFDQFFDDLDEIWDWTIFNI